MHNSLCFPYLQYLLSLQDKINMEFQNGSMECHFTVQKDNLCDEYLLG